MREAHAVESVEIRLRVDGECECGTPKPIGYEHKCRHWFECDWGTLDNTEADPARGLQHLILITGESVHRMLHNGPEPGTCGGTASVSVDGERLFVHLDHDGGRTTWELFAAYFSDGLGPDDLYIGRWPD